MSLYNRFFLFGVLFGALGLILALFFLGFWALRFGSIFSIGWLNFLSSFWSVFPFGWLAIFILYFHLKF